MLAFVLMATALAGAPVSEEAAWLKLRRGMSVAQVTELVGVPMMRSAARGHELWVYDAGGQVQLHGGALTAWTAPRSTRATGATAVSEEPAAAATAAKAEAESAATTKRS